MLTGPAHLIPTAPGSSAPRTPLLDVMPLAWQDFAASHIRHSAKGPLMRQRVRARQQHAKRAQRSPDRQARTSQSPSASGATAFRPTVPAAQAVVGNAWVARTVSEGGARHSRAGAPVVQRMSTTEAYYQNTLGTKGIANAFRIHPTMRAFISNLTQYNLLSRNAANTQSVRTMTDRLNAVARHAFNLVGVRDEVEQEFPNPDQNDQQLIERAIRAAIEDVNQEERALQQLSIDPNLNGSGMTWQQAIFASRAGVPLTSVKTDQSLAPGTNGQQVGNPKRLGGGQVSEVTALDYNEPNAPGGRERRVFKPNEVNPGTVAGELDDKNVQTSFRVVAAARVQELIRQQMQIANRQFTLLIGKVELALHDNQMGTTSSFAKGNEGMKAETANTGRILSQSYLNVDFNDIELQRQVANLQLFDIICGQLDRHMGNVMVKQDNTGTEVTGIDNDFAFSSSSNSTDTIGGGGSKTLMPGIIDQFFAEAVLAVNEGAFQGALKGLSSAEIRAAVARFTDVKAQLRQKDAAAQLVTLSTAPNRKPNQRTWDQISLGDYSQRGRWSSEPGDYMAQLGGSRNDALAGLRANPPGTFLPEIKDGKWALKYDTAGLFLMARTNDGSDLWDVVIEALPRNSMTRAAMELNKDPQLAPEKVAGRWILRFPGGIAVSRDPNGDDIWGLVRRARRAKGTWTMGNRPPRQTVGTQ